MSQSNGHIASLIRYGIGVLAAIAALGVYMLTLAPTVTFIDSGELTTVCATLSIAHPTGYPLYTLLGRLFILLPIGSNKAFQLNLLSALFATLAVFIFYNLMIHLQINCRRARQERSQKRVNVPRILLVSAVTALLLGFSKTFWSQALVTEVYSLHVFFIVTIILCILRISEGDRENENTIQTAKLYCIFAFLFGLGMTNHMTIVVLAPACLYLLLVRVGVKGLVITTSKILFPGFLLGLSVYLYLPIRSAVQPILDWGNPETFGNLLRHLSGKQYQVWMFSSFDVAKKQLGAFVETLPLQFSPFLLPLVLLGLWWLYRNNRRILWFTVIVFAFDLFYSINYDIHDIESYFLPCFIIAAIWIGLGLVQICDYLKSDSKVYQYVVCGLIVISPIFPLWLHFDEVDRSREYFVTDYSHNLLKGIDQGGIIISRQWDFFCSPFSYFQYVEGVRQDVVLIEQELLRRSWYYPQLQRQYPWLLQASQSKVTAFLKDLEKFERNEPYDRFSIQRNYMAMIESFIMKNIDSRAVYVTPEVEQSVGMGYVKVPEGLAYRLYRDERIHPFEMPNYSYRGIRDREYSDYFHLRVISFYRNMWTARGTYLSRQGHCADALGFFREALRVDPNNEQAQKELKRCVTFLEATGESVEP